MKNSQDKILKEVDKTQKITQQIMLKGKLIQTICSINELQMQMLKILGLSKNKMQKIIEQCPTSIQKELSPKKLKEVIWQVQQKVKKQEKTRKNNTSIFKI